MSTERTASTARERISAAAIAMIAFAVITAASLVVPVVTPFLAATGLVASWLLLRGKHETVYKITLAMFAVALVVALAMDLSLLSVGSHIGRARPATPR